MIKLRFRSGNMRFSAWHLLPTIRLGFWPEKNGGFLAFTFLKFDACLTWAVTPNAGVNRRTAALSPGVRLDDLLGDGDAK